MKIKRIMSGILAVTLAASLCACENTEESSEANDSTDTTAVTVVTTTAPAPETTAPETTTTVATTEAEETTTTTQETTATTTTTTTATTTTTTTTAATTTKAPETTVTTTKATTTAIVTEKASGTMYANQSANVRKGNGTNYDVVATVKKNEAVTITGKCSNGWYAVKTAAGKTGYMSSKVLSANKVTEATTTTKKPTTTTTTKREETPVTSYDRKLFPAVQENFTVEVYQDATIIDLNNSGARIKSFDIKYSEKDVTEDDFGYMQSSKKMDVFAFIPTKLTVTIIWTQDNIDGTVMETTTVTHITVI